MRNTEGTAIFHVLWEQDSMKDLLESAAFRLPPSAYRPAEGRPATLVNESYRHVLHEREPNPQSPGLACAASD